MLPFQHVQHGGAREVIGQSAHQLLLLLHPLENRLLQQRRRRPEGVALDPGWVIAQSAARPPLHGRPTRSRLLLRCRLALGRFPLLVVWLLRHVVERSNAGASAERLALRLVASTT